MNQPGPVVGGQPISLALIGLGLLHSAAQPGLGDREVVPIWGDGRLTPSGQLDGGTSLLSAGHTNSSKATIVVATKVPELAGHFAP